MCYNCGCGLINNDMGKPENITEQTIIKAAEANRMSVEQAKKNILEALKKQIEAK